MLCVPAMAPALAQGTQALALVMVTAMAPVLAPMTAAVKGSRGVQRPS